MLNKARVVQDDDIIATMTERRVLTLGGECPFLAQMHAGFQVSQRITDLARNVLFGTNPFSVGLRVVVWQVEDDVFNQLQSR